MSNDHLEPFNYHNIAFKRCADVVSLERLDRLWFFRHHWFVKIGWFGKCWTDVLAFWGVWNRSRILNFGPDRLFFRFSRALVLTPLSPSFIQYNWGLQEYTLIFLFLLKNRDCGYSLELPYWGNSNEYPRSVFWAEIWKLTEFFIWKFSFFGGKILNIFE